MARRPLPRRGWPDPPSCFPHLTEKHSSRIKTQRGILAHSGSREEGKGRETGERSRGGTGTLDYAGPADQEADGSVLCFSLARPEVEPAGLGRIGRLEEDIGNAVVALCGNEMGYLTGATIPLDGGQANFD